MRRRGARVRILPHTISTAVALAADIDGLILSPGPGRPGPARRARSRWPGRSSRTAGRCSGSAWVTRSWRRAAGADTTPAAVRPPRREPPGPRRRAGLVQVTAQNHEVQVVGDSLPAAVGFRVSQVNLNDGSVEGLRHATLPIETVQYHPEGAPGPLDALAVFDRFVAAARRGLGCARRSDRRRRPSARPRAPQAGRQRPDPRLRAGRHRPGRRVRLRRHPGLPRPPRRGRPDDPRQQQPGDDHDRPAGRRRHLPRAADRRGGRGGHRQGAAGGPARRPRRPDRPQPRDRAGRGRRLRAPRDPAPRHAARGDPDGRGPRGVPRPARPDRPAVRAERHRRGRDAARRASASRGRGPREIGLPAIVRPPSRSAGPAAGSSRPRRPTASGSGPASARARSAR